MSRGKWGLIALAVLVAIASIVWVVVFKKDCDLLDACERCDAAEVERLLERGANPNAQRKGVLRRPVTALMLAVSCDRVPTKGTNEPIGDPRVVKLLLDHGADMNRACGEGTLLHWAVGRPPMDDEDPEEQLWKFLGFRLRPAPGNPEVIKLLLAAGADINAGTVNAGTSRFTPLDLAIRCGPETGNIDCIHLLIQNGATSSVPQCAFAYMAWRSGSHDLFELLIQKGCDANLMKTWWDLQNPYLVVTAANRGDKEVVRRLLEITPKIDEEILAWAVYHNCLDLVRELLDRGMDVDYRWRDGSDQYASNLSRCREMFMPIISIAACRGHVEMTNLLIERGANVNARCRQGRGPGALDAALYQGHSRLADILRSHGAQEYGLR